jgi:hypothetical protein
VSDHLLRAARELVADLRLAHDREVIADATGWVVLCHDLEQKTVSAHGFWEKEDLANAMRYAHNWQQDLNRDIRVDEYGWRCDVVPLEPIDPMFLREEVKE